MRLVKLSFVVVAVLACAAWRGHPWVYPLVSPAPYSADSEVRTTAGDPILLRQRMIHGPFARLDAPVRVVRGSKVYEVTPENLLFAAESSGRRVFCTYDVTYRGRNSLGIGASGRTCIEDNNQDGEFEAIAWVSVGDFNRNIVQFSADIAPPARYSAATNDAPPSVEMVVRYSGRANEEPVLELMYVEGVFENALRDPPVQVPSALPAVVTVQGARIEILSRTDGVLTYRVLSGFDTSVHRPIDLPRW